MIRFGLTRWKLLLSGLEDTKSNYSFLRKYPPRKQEKSQTVLVVACFVRRIKKTKKSKVIPVTGRGGL
jgi:hypothetical protein